ncbi:pentatricopeptide repeat-containing protein At1g33350-like [Neltuma alba]|uniref:pentatricopeptide repeat-containing protein At1g33350-like n=1 Tax=Neltuma alba TaxID=207710 RepID=UPI0010A4002F|nr:pentatricopeptide repeat-containing protein At1g33350-like [Prosopis alba]
MSSWAAALRNASSPRKALHLYAHMHRNAVHFDSFCILFTLKSCTSLQNAAITRHLHAHIVKLGFSSHVYVATSLLNAYIAVSFPDACLLFDEMPEKSIISWNSMITGYSRLGDIPGARSVFDEMPHWDVASWSAMIAAYANNGYYQPGLSLFRSMVAGGRFRPDEITANSVLSVCAHMGALGLLAGKSVHGFMVKNGWDLSVELGTVLVNMYAKCGFLKFASQVFALMQERNVISWTSLICGFAQHGYNEEALTIFEKMQLAGIRPNELTFTGVLSACVHAGSVGEGREYFKMIERHGLEPRIQHYGCMVDLLGKAGKLEEAYEVIRAMKLEPNVVVWGSFLSACKEHGQFEMAERVIGQVLRMVKPENDGGMYTLICDLYVLGQKREEAERLRKLMIDSNVRKSRGSSFVRTLLG